MTPEARVKEAIKRVLVKRYPDLYYHMPVQNGMGAPTLDFVGVYKGFYFTIEAKAPDRNPTARQEITLGQVKTAGGKVFIIKTVDDTQLEEWFELVDTVRVFVTTRTN